MVTPGDQSCTIGCAAARSAVPHPWACCKVKLLLPEGTSGADLPKQVDVSRRRHHTQFIMAHCADSGYLFGCGKLLWMKGDVDNRSINPYTWQQYSSPKPFQYQSNKCMMRE